MLYMWLPAAALAMRMGTPVMQMQAPMGVAPAQAYGGGVVPTSPDASLPSDSSGCGAEAATAAASGAAPIISRSHAEPTWAAGVSQPGIGP